MPVDLGDVVPLVLQVRDPSGAPANAGAVALTVTLPDGTTSTPSVANPPAVTGVYTVDYSPLQPGRHLVRWVATGPNARGHTDAFDVRPAAPPLLFSLVDAKILLSIGGATHDELIRDLIESTTAAIEHLVGPVVRQTVSERHNGGSRTLVLRRPPVIAVQSITPILTEGTTYPLADVDVDPGTGIVQLVAGRRRFAGPLRVTYTAGRPVTPSAIRDAARIVLKHLWRIRNGVDGLPGIGPPGDYGETLMPSLGYALPDAALQLLAPYMRGPMV